MVEKKDQNKKKKTKAALPILYVLIGISLLVIVFFAYRIIPSTNKINGNWIATDEPYEMTIKNKKFVCKSNNLQGQEGIDLIMKGDLETSKTEKYKGKNVIVYLEIDKKNLSQLAIDEMKSMTDMYKVIKDDKVLQLQYLPETIFDSFKIEDPDRLFNISIFQYKKGIKVDKIKLQNQAFAKDNIVFEKED